MVDKSLLLRKLAELDECSGQIREYAHVTVEQYSSNWKVQRIIERTLKMMIETCVDIASHIQSCPNVDKNLNIDQPPPLTFRVASGVLPFQLIHHHS